ncbi:MAG: dTDP-glucose 4,6-dehydratase [Gammaproteobacteria bacterium]
MSVRKILVTGGSGFIGSNFVRYWLKRYPEDRVINLDSLTYAGNPENLREVESCSTYRFVHGDIQDSALVGQLFSEEAIDTVIHFAAESHVDRSILGPDAFVQTNVNGTFTLLEAARGYWQADNGRCRFLHVSTDEVYGSLGPKEPAFTEQTRYEPNSPYSASKAAADHLARAYWKTYGLPVLISNCSNNYGPFQFPEKLIPLVILNALENRPIPVYGDGNNVRDWLFVEDHCSGLEAILAKGRVGEVYNIGGANEWRNIDIVTLICDRLDALQPADKPRRELITFVQDRPGHDRRYAVDSSKIQQELAWTPAHDFRAGLDDTLRWYLDNQEWCNRVRSGEYQRYYDKMYG